MATSNPALTGAWVKIADEGQAFFLSLRTEANFNQPLSPVALAVTDTDAAPGAGIAGRVIDPAANEGITRTQTGPGTIWARTVLAGFSLSAALDAWV